MAPWAALIVFGFAVPEPYDLLLSSQPARFHWTVELDSSNCDGRKLDTES